MSEGTSMVSGTPVRQDGRKLWQYLSSISACMLAVGCGSALGWPSPVLPELYKSDAWLVVTEAEGSWISSLLAVGALPGALVAGKMADKIGRKKSMLILAAPFLLSWAIIMMVSQLWLIYAARLIVGLGVGASCVVVPTYVSEIAETSARGTLGAFFQLFFTVGIVLVFVCGSVINYTALAIVCAVVEVLFVISFFWMPESPVWLMSQMRKSEAAAAMTVLRGDVYDPGEELGIMQKSAEEATARKASITDLISTRGARRALIVSFGCMIFQQLSGINAVIANTFTIFQMAGSSMAPSVASIVVALVQMVMSGLAAIVIDKAGRKPLLMASSSGMSVCLIALGLYFKLQMSGSESVASLGWLPLTSLTVFMIAFSIGLGPVPWMINGEIFPSERKAVASGLAVTLNWALVFLVTKTFPAMQSGLGADWTFWLFAAIMAGSTAFTYIIVPETKGKDIQEVQEELEGGARAEDKSRA